MNLQLGRLNTVNTKSHGNVNKYNAVELVIRFFRRRITDFSDLQSLVEVNPFGQHRVLLAHLLVKRTVEALDSRHFNGAVD